MRRGRRRPDVAAVDLDAPRVRRAGRARRERKARHRRDRRQRLAAKAERGDRIEIVDRRELRRRMPLYREQQVLALDARAVVRDAQAPDAAAFDIDVDLGGARVERVLEQLLQRRRGALDDLAGGDLVDEMVGQRSDSGHGREGQSAGTPMISSALRNGYAPEPAARRRIALRLGAAGGFAAADDHRRRRHVLGRRRAAAPAARSSTPRAPTLRCPTR